MVIAKTCRMEFIESVQKDDTRSLCRRYVALRRKLKTNPTDIKLTHAKIMKEELIKRIRNSADKY